jgi:predicted permease
VPIGWRVLGVALASAISVTVASSVAPAAAAARIATRVAWPGSTRGLTVGRTGIRSAIAAGQVALCILALVLTGMFARGLSRVASVDVGFSDPEHVLLVDTDFGAARLTDAAGTAALERLVTQLRAIPGVQSATVASMVPLGFGGRRIVEARVAGYAPAPNENMSVERAHVGAKYATTMKIAVVEGRDILDEDRAATTPVALVNQAFVTRFLPGRPAIGNQVDVAGGWATIVGVLHDGKYDRLDEPLHPVVYVPYAQWFLPSMTIHVRTTEDPRAVADPVRQALLSINMDLPALQTRTLAEHISASTFVPRTGTRVLSAVSAAAIGLAIVGLYGSLSFAVAVRAREFGIRLALGAGARRIARDVFTQALVVVGAGVAVGSGLGLFAGQILKAHVSSVGSVDPLLWIGSVLLLCVAAAIAAFGPARRAVRIDPATSVRGD